MFPLESWVESLLCSVSCCFAVAVVRWGGFLALTTTLLAVNLLGSVPPFAAGWWTLPYALPGPLLAVAVVAAGAVVSLRPSVTVELTTRVAGTEEETATLVG